MGGISHLPVALCGLALASACVGSAPAGSVGNVFQRDVQVVLVGTFSGPSGSWGDYLRNSLQVEIDEINAGGGLLGSRVDLVAADDEGRPAKAADLVREHLADGSVRLLVGPGSAGTFLGARPAIIRSGVPNCVSGPVPDAAVEGAVTTFRTQGSARDRFSALLGYVRSQTRVRSVGLLSLGDDAGQYADQQLGTLAPALGLRYAGAAQAARDSADFRPALQQLVARGAQGVVLPDDPSVAGQVARAIADLGAPGPLAAFGLGGLARPLYPQFGADAAVGTVVVATIHSYLTDAPASSWPPAYHDFVRRIVSKYGYAADGIEIKGAPEAADCVLLWASAVERADSFEGRRVVQAWEGLDVPAAQSALGVAERFSATARDAGGPFVYRWVREGARYRLKPLVAP